MADSAQNQVTTNSLLTNTTSTITLKTVTSLVCALVWHNQSDYEAGCIDVSVIFRYKQWIMSHIKNMRPFKVKQWSAQFSSVNSNHWRRCWTIRQWNYTETCTQTHLYTVGTLDHAYKHRHWQSHGTQVITVVTCSTWKRTFTSITHNYFMAII